jgi:hypothetical protein
MSQLLFLVETTPQCNSDYLYIRAFIAERYRLYNPTPKLTAIYLRGKSHYQDKEKEILSKRHQYPGNTEIILCFDTDEGNESKKINSLIEGYCRKKNYRLVWFHRDVEEVFLGRRLSSKETAIKKERSRAIRPKECHAKTGPAPV